MNERENNLPRRRNQRRKRRIRPAPLFSAVLLALCIGTVGWGLQGAFQLEPAPGKIPPDNPTAAIDIPQSDADTTDNLNSDLPWYLLLVNRWNPLPEDYEVGLVNVPGGEKVDERIYDPLMEMLDAAEAEDLGPKVVSGFRTEKTQQSLYDDKIREYYQQGYSQEEAAREIHEQGVCLEEYLENLKEESAA